MILKWLHIQEVQRVHMDEDPPMDEVSSNEVCEEAETGGHTLGFLLSFKLLREIRVSSFFQTSSAS
jgi:hypothetical protein